MVSQVSSNYIQYFKNNNYSRAKSFHLKNTPEIMIGQFYKILRKRDGALAKLTNSPPQVPASHKGTS